jgi:hypothetical protein
MQVKRKENALDFGASCSFPLHLKRENLSTSSGKKSNTAGNNVPLNWQTTVATQ